MKAVMKPYPMSEGKAEIHTRFGTLFLRVQGDGLLITPAEGTELRSTEPGELPLGAIQVEVAPMSPKSTAVRFMDRPWAYHTYQEYMVPDGHNEFHMPCKRGETCKRYVRMQNGSDLMVLDAYVQEWETSGWRLVK